MGICVVHQRAMALCVVYQRDTAHVLSLAVSVAFVKSSSTPSYAEYMQNREKTFFIFFYFFFLRWVYTEHRKNLTIQKEICVDATGREDINESWHMCCLLTSHGIYIVCQQVIGICVVYQRVMSHVLSWHMCCLTMTHARIALCIDESRHMCCVLTSHGTRSTYQRVMAHVLSINESYFIHSKPLYLRKRELYSYISLQTNPMFVHSRPRIRPQKSPMGWLWLVGSNKLKVSLAKEPCKRDNILQKRPMIWSILLTVATPYVDKCCPKQASCFIPSRDLKFAPKKTQSSYESLHTSPMLHPFKGPYTCTKEPYTYKNFPKRALSFLHTSALMFPQKSTISEYVSAKRFRFAEIQG